MAMRAGSLLDLWTASRDEPWAVRAMLLADAARPSASDGASSGATPEPVGRSTAAMLRLHRELAGDSLTTAVPCPDCGQDLELAMPIADLLGLETEVRAEAGMVHIAGRDLTLRPPGFADVAAVVGHDPARMAEALARRCIVDDAPPELDDDTVAAIERAVEAADPLVEIRVGFVCADCGARFDAQVDVTTHVWAEVDAHARELVAEIDLLAHRYGWSERDILALGDARRRLYLEHLGEAW